MITAPGIYPDLTPKVYHADPCERPSLSSTIAKVMCSRSPRHAWLAHPRLGDAPEGDAPEGEEKVSKQKLLGSLLHRLVLGKGGDNLLDRPAEAVMSPHPKVISRTALAAEAVGLMERHSITVLIVTDAEQRVEGVVHLHDLLKAGVV